MLDHFWLLFYELFLDRETVNWPQEHNFLSLILLNMTSILSTLCRPFTGKDDDIEKETDIPREPFRNWPNDAGVSHSILHLH